MLNKFINFVEKENLSDKKQPTILAVSGGIDSVVMAALYHQAGLQFSIAHCSFNLRGAESDQDELFVKNLAEYYQVPSFFKSFDTLKFANRNKLSVQMAARQLRYTWFEELVSKENYHSYATAHHLDDQIETFFINMLRGTGISGLHGILSRQGNLIHPLMFAYRNEIIEFAKQNNLKYREDSSNIKTIYTRNKIRHDLLPIIEDINPAYKNVITENIYRFQQAEIIYNEKITEEISKVFIKNGESDRIDIKKLLLLKPHETYLYEMLKPYHFNYADVKDIISSLKGIAGKQFFSDSHRLIKDRDFLIIEKRKFEDQSKDTSVLISENDLNIEFPVKLKLKIIAKDPSFKIPSDIGIACLDLSKLSFPLKIRKWEKGDYFYPLGMKQKKLLSDFFIDNKFSIIEKENTWLLLSGQDIIWIIGYRIDERYKISGKTTKIYQLNIYHIGKEEKI